MHLSDLFSFAEPLLFANRRLQAVILDLLGEKKVHI